MSQGPFGNPQEASSLVGGFRTIRERWWVVLAAIVVVGAVVMGLALSATKQYSATSSLLMEPSKITGLIDPAANQTEDPVRDASTNLLLVQSTTVANRVKVALKAPESPDALLGHIVVAAEPDANIITIEATDPSPARAALLANTFADQFVEYRKESDRKRVAEGEQLLRGQIAALPAAAVAQRAELEQTLRAVTALRAVTTGDAEVVDRATVPGSPSSPILKKSAAIALILGLVIGIALVFLVDLFDRRIKNGDEFEMLYGLRALTSVPERSKDPASQRDRAAALEPFRILRGSLRSLQPDREIRVVLVTSAVPGEGKSTTAAGLARAAALSGQRVVLVEADLRRPTFHQQFDLGGDQRGLTTALVGGTPVANLLRTVLPGLKSLMVLPSGPKPPNSAELLRSAEMGRVLDDLKIEADLIVLDAPPLLPVADAQVLIDHPQVDAVLITARAYLTTREEVRRTRNILERHPGSNFGLVVNGIRVLDAGYDYYGSAETASVSRAR